MLLAKTKLKTVEVLISKGLIKSYINHDKFDLVKNVLREYMEMKEEIKNLENVLECTTQIQWKHDVPVVRKILWTKILLSEKLNKIDSSICDNKNPVLLKIKKWIIERIRDQNSIK